MIISSRNVVVIDMPVEEAPGLKESLEYNSGHSWQVMPLVANDNKNTLKKNLLRYYKYIYFSTRLFTSRKRIANLVTWQEFYGLFFAFFCRLFHVKKRTKLLILTFMYAPRRGLIGKLYKEFFKYAICNDYVDHIVCFSSEEINYYIKEFYLDPNKISFFPVAVMKMDQYDTTIDDKKYIFSAGRSGRDFDFLIRALNGSEYNVIIADNNVTEEADNNIVIDKQSTGSEMYKLLAHSYCFIVPLKNKLKSAGHLMSLQAFQLGKPVISTDSYGMRPYLVNEWNGLFINNTKDDLLNALDRLYSDKTFYDMLSKNALLTYENYSFSKLGQRIIELDNKIHLFNN